MRHNPRLSPSVLGLLLALVIPSVLIVDAARTNAAAPDEKVSQVSPGAAAARVRQNYGQLPLSFEPNRGQADARVQFLARNDAYSVYLTADEIALALRDPAGREGGGGRRDASGPSVLRIKLLGASAEPRAAGLEQLEGKSNYLFGRDPARWRTNVPNYGRVRYERVYPGVDVVYYGTRRQLEYDFNLAPGADARVIRMRVEGARGVRIDENGDLVLPTAAGEVRQHAPQAHQEVEGARQAVACRYVLRGAGRVGFELGEYDRSKPLVIDPVLTYSTFLGGNDYDEANSVAVDAQGNAYVVGAASSWDFPVTAGALQPRRGGAMHVYAYDAFVSKLNQDGTALVYSTFLGGTRDDHATSIALDAAGHAYVAGFTGSQNFPVTAGAYRTSPAGGGDLFVAKLDPTGAALVYSTYLGGTGTDYDPHIALGSGGEAYVGGWTQSADYPVTPGAFQAQANGVAYNSSEGYVTKLNASGSALVFSTYLGGTGDDMVEGLAVGGAEAESVYVTGRTASVDFPITPYVVQMEHAEGNTPYDVFVTRLSADGSAALYSTYLGGAGDEFGRAVAVDGAGAAYVGGVTYSDSLPVTGGAFQPDYTPGVGPEPGADGFVAKLSPNGRQLLYLTYFGGVGDDEVHAVAADSYGNAYVAGQTSSPSLPVTADAFQSTYGGMYDGFFFKLNDTGTAVPYATYVGRSEWDAVRGVAVDSAGGVYLTGTTYSHNFPFTIGAFQVEPGDVGSKSDGFVMKLDFGAPDFSVTGRVTNQFGNGLGDVYVSVSGSYEAAVSTDANGYYTITGIPTGAYVTVSANRYGFDFSPSVWLENLSENKTVDFTGPAPLVIQGRLLDEGGSGFYWPITITSDDGSVILTHDTFFEGRYRFAVPAGGNYTVTPFPSVEYQFTPPSQTFNNLTADQNFDFQAQRPPRIFGRVTDAESYSGDGLAGVRVTLTGPTLAEPLVQTTDEWGYFFFEELERGATYTVTPSDPVTNRSFEPAGQAIENIQGWEFVSFTALPLLAINGRVLDGDDNPVNAIVTLTGTVNAEVEVNNQLGFFSFPNLPRGGDYTVTVTKPGSLYTFAPPSHSVTNLQALQVLDFEALPPLTIRGHVADADNNKIPATVTLSGTLNATKQADEFGVFFFENLPRGGDYTVTVSYPLYTFEPPSRSVTNIQSDQIFTFEALPPLRIDGHVADENGGVAGVTVTLSGTVNRTATTNQWGAYNFTDLPRGGAYVVTPAHELYAFTPASWDFPTMHGDQVAVFNGELRRFRLSGRVTGAGGAPLAGVDVFLGGGYEDLRQTDENGNYVFYNLKVGSNYTLTPVRPGYSFAPATRNVNDPRGDQTADFTGAHLTYTLAGRVTDGAGGAGIAGAAVTLGGSLAATAQTDAQGNYTFTGLPSEGNYTVSVSHPHFGFEPGTRSFNNLLADASGDFAGTRLKRQIGGRVADASGAAVSGATVTLGGAGAATVQTDASGSYLFPDLPSGFDYTVTVTRAHYAFSPPTRQLDGLGADATADFTATLLRHRISGRVVDASGNGFAGAVVGLVGGPGGAVTTDATGNYLFDNLPAGQPYAVEPSRQFYSFSPARASWLDLGADQTADFTATLNTYSLGGRVTEGAAGVAGVTVSLSGTRTATAQTDAAGNYVFTSLPADGTYAVTPAATAVYTFSPASASFNTLRYNETANFAAARRLYQVGGSALDACGRAIAGVTLSLTHDGVTVSAQTNVAGAYTFANVPAGYNYTLAPAGSAYTFAPASFAFPALSANQTGNFTGRPPAATADVFALADLYVRGGNNAGTYFGTSTQLIARLASQAKDTYESYLKFNVGQPCTVASVKLRLYGHLSASGNLPVVVYGVPVTTWTETGTNWNNRPAAGALLRTVNVPGTTAAWYEWDVTDYVRAELAAGRTDVAFALKSTTTTNYQVTFNSREATGPNAPRLVITTP